MTQRWTCTRRSFWFLPLILFFLLFAPNLLREGMFVDGIWYAAISNNLAQGIGDFWRPSFTETIFPNFYEHPPLVFWIQSQFFQVFGDHFFVERLYCFLVFILTAWIVVLIWKKVFHAKPELAALGYLPLVVWMLNTGIFFAYPNNVLECTMTLFLSASIYFMITSIQATGRIRYVHIAIAGIGIALGFLTKGFVALFPLIFYFIHWGVFKVSFKRSLYDSAVLIGIFATVIFLILQNPEAKIFFERYLDVQVISALQGQRVENLRESRFYLLFGLLNSFVIVGIVCLLLIISNYQTRKNFTTSVSLAAGEKNWGISFLLIGLSASLPLLISLKQAGYYLVPSITFFSIFIGIYIAPIVLNLLRSLEKFKYRRGLLGLGAALLVVSMLLALNNIGTIDKRDKNRIAIVKEVSRIVPEGKVLSSNFESFDHSLHGFFQRYHLVALDTVQSNMKERAYLLSDTELSQPEAGYELIDSFEGVYLYKKVD